MSVKSTTIFPCERYEWEPTGLTVGNYQVMHHLKQLVQDCCKNLQLKTDSMIGKNIIATVFGRDNRVVRLDGSHLIPFEIKLNEELLWRSLVLLPASSNHFILNLKDTCFGLGFSSKLVKGAVKNAIENEIPYKQGKTCIEGGNCHLFLCDDIPKAIIGYHSVILSLLALEDQGYFQSLEIREKLKRGILQIEKPTDDSLRMARNHFVYKQFKEPFNQLLEKRNPGCDRFQRLYDLDLKFQKYNFCFRRGFESIGDSELSNFQDNYARHRPDSLSNDVAYRYRIAAPLTENERSNPEYLRLACEFQVKIDLVKELICDELGVLPENTAFILQERFHIDMETTVDPSGKFVYMQDEEQVIASCNSLIQAQPAVSNKSLRLYKDAAKKRLKAHRSTHATVCNELAKIRCIAAKVPGVFESAEEKTINFLNGCFVTDGSREIFITNGNASIPILNNCFIAQMKKFNPNLDIRFLQGALMQKFLTHSDGGLHCLTWPSGKIFRPLNENQN